VPLMLLAVLSVAGGWIGIPHVLGGHNYFEEWLAPVFAHGAEGAAHGGAHASAALEYLLMAGSVGVALCGIGLAWYLYRVRTEKPKEIADRVPGLYDLVLNKYYVDEIYDVAIVRKIVNGSIWLWEAFDDVFIDGIVNGIAALVKGAGTRTRRLQTGVVGNYAFSLLLGAVILVGFLLWS
ncbi:MAG: NADH-quinone oxidoreductase subunit L, partial [Deltaproteobacteria bacterium]|nr:NADH-quinone oxidoreductase subunit L [Deltaproteobacteria bacterium]